MARVIKPKTLSNRIIRDNAICKEWCCSNCKYADSDIFCPKRFKGNMNELPIYNQNGELIKERRYELKRIQIVGASCNSKFHDKVDDVYWAIRDNEDVGGVQPYGIITEPTDTLLVKETIDKANNDEHSCSLLTFDCPFNIEWEFNTITQCVEV